MKADLASLPRFGDFSVECWPPGRPKVVGEFGGLALEIAVNIFTQARVAILEEGRSNRAEGVKLAKKIERPLYRADNCYVVDALLSLCGYRHFERRNVKKRKQAGVPLVRSKHPIAAEYAEGQADRRDHALAPTQNSLPTSLSLEARKAKARGGQKP